MVRKTKQQAWPGRGAPGAPHTGQVLRMTVYAAPRASDRKPPRGPTTPRPSGAPHTRQGTKPPIPQSENPYQPMSCLPPSAFQSWPIGLLQEDVGEENQRPSTVSSRSFWQNSRSCLRLGLAVCTRRQLGPVAGERVSGTGSWSKAPQSGGGTGGQGAQGTPELVCLLLGTVHWGWRSRGSPRDGAMWQRQCPCCVGLR